MTTTPETDRLISQDIIACITRALGEDIGSGDVTTDSIVAPEARATARVIAKEEGVVAGLDVTSAVFLQLDEDMGFNASVTEGARVSRDQVLATLTGSARAIL